LSQLEKCDFPACSIRRRQERSRWIGPPVDDELQSLALIGFARLVHVPIAATIFSRATACAPGPIKDPFIDVDLIGKYVHMKAIVPSHRDQTPPEIIDFAFDGSAGRDTHETLVSADSAVCLTALSLAMMQHLGSPPRGHVSHKQQGQDGCQNCLSPSWHPIPLSHLGKQGSKQRSALRKSQNSKLTRPILILGMKTAADRTDVEIR
jgi:hypothetical protein